MTLKTSPQDISFQMCKNIFCSPSIIKQCFASQRIFFGGNMIKKLFTPLLLLTTLSVPTLSAQNSTPVNNESFLKNQISNLDIKLICEDLEIKETYGDEILIEVYCNNRKKAPSIECRNETLYISSKVNFTVIGFTCKVKVYLPANQQFSNVKIEGTSSDISIDALSAKDLYLNTTSGDIQCTSLSIDNNAKITSTSGEIHIEEITTKELTSKTTSGEISCEKISCDTATITSNSGEINIDDFYGEYFKINTTSGEIDIYNIDTEYFTAGSTSGEISLDFKKIISAKSQIKTTSGEIQIFVPQNSSFNVAVSSTSGTFKDKISGNRLTPRAEYIQKYNEGGAQITIRTTSGNITLED